MKKGLCILVMSLMILGMLLFATTPTNVLAMKIDTPQPIPGIAANEWSAGEEMDVDLSLYPAPSWLQLLTKATKITTPGQICHEFRGGQFKWVGEIRQLKDGKWV